MFILFFMLFSLALNGASTATPNRITASTSGEISDPSPTIKIPYSPFSPMRREALRSPERSEKKKLKTNKTSAVSDAVPEDWGSEDIFDMD